jgi:hypothetical protein
MDSSIETDTLTMRSLSFEHMGIIAAFCFKYGLIGFIDELLSEKREFKVSNGEAFLALILQGI